MPTIKFTQALKRFFPDLKDVNLSSDSLTEVMENLDQSFPGIKSYIVDEQGVLRKHVNIFIDGELIDDRENLTDSFRPNSEIHIIQALSGG